MESVQLTTADGHVLDADLERADGERGGVVICHPHPAYGGDRFNIVVDALFRALPVADLTALRFDFRRGDGSGEGERFDLAAAVDHLAAVTDAPLLLAGYSFGAAVALGLDDSRVRAVAAIAPPLSMMDVEPPATPTLVLTPRHDQFSPPDTTGPIVGAWEHATFEVVESADHFLAGHASDVANRVCSWFTSRLDGG